MEGEIVGVCEGDGDGVASFESENVDVRGGDGAEEGESEMVVAVVTSVLANSVSVWIWSSEKKSISRPSGAFVNA